MAPFRAATEIIVTALTSVAVTVLLVTVAWNSGVLPESGASTRMARAAAELYVTVLLVDQEPGLRHLAGLAAHEREDRVVGRACGRGDGVAPDRGLEQRSGVALAGNLSRRRSPRRRSRRWCCSVIAVS